MKRLVFLTLTTIALSACMPYSKNYGCKGYPDGVACVDMQTVYEETHNRDRLTQSDIQGSDSSGSGDPHKHERHSKSYTGKKAGQPDIPTGEMVEKQYQDYPQEPDPTITPDYTLPIRKPASVMRIWIAPWVDENDDLMMSGYVYSEIKKRTWNIGEPTVDGRSSNLTINNSNFDTDRTSKSEVEAE